MPLVMQITERGVAPVILCDKCGERIIRAQDGNCVFDGDREPGTYSPIILLHKDCDTFSPEYGYSNSGEMTWLPGLLRANLQMEIGESEQIIERLRELGL